MKRLLGRKGRGVIAVIMLAGMMTFLGGCNNGDVNDAVNHVAAYGSRKADAYRVATQLIKEQLDAPSTAVFPTYQEDFVTEGDASDTEYDEMYVVTSSVETENLVGGRTTIEYTVNVYGDSSDNTWDAELVDVQ